jgi:hypothetical protein
VKPKTCKADSCRKRFTPERPFQNACSVPCSIEVARAKAAAKRERDVKDRRRAIRAEIREGMEKLKTLKDLCVDAQEPVNAYVRARDAGLKCISCSTGNVEQAGHFFPIGSKYRCSRLRFWTKAIHGQCVQCNHSAGGNVHGYIAGIVARYGADYLEELYEYKRRVDSGNVAPLSRDEVKQIAADHRRMTRELRRAA